MLKKHAFTIVIAFAVPLLAVYAWWGGFNAVEVSEAQRGPYRYAYLEHTGPLAEVVRTQAAARKALEAQGIRPNEAITVLLTDPRKVGGRDIRAQTGYLVAPGVVVAPPLAEGYIPARRVLVARVRAAALLAPSKAYQALYEHLRAKNEDIRMPTVELYTSPPEIYRVGEFSVEMEPAP